MPPILRAHGAFLKLAGNDNVPLHRRIVSNAALALGVVALIIGIAVFHSLAVFL